MPERQRGSYRQSQHGGAIRAYVCFEIDAIPPISDGHGAPRKTIRPSTCSRSNRLMRLGRLSQRIPRRNGHADPAVAEVTIQLDEFTRIRDCVEGMQAERASRHRNRSGPGHWNFMQS